MLSITASVTNSSNNSVTWSLSGAGKLSNQTSTSVTYNAPPTVTSNQNATVTATAAASSSSMATLSITVLAPGSTSNVQPIAVDGGPVANVIYQNGAFTTVTICEPGTSTCQAIPGILVDTGSVGLRVLQSALTTIQLSPLTANGNTLNDCISFVDGSFLWGTVAPADVKLAGEVAAGVSVHLVADPSFQIPSTCSNGGIDEDNQAGLGANGILGVGPEPFDCGFACDPNGGESSPPVPAYYACSSSGSCQPTFVSCGPECSDSAANQQVTNPVTLFTTDNNGVILNFQTVTSSEATLNGSMIFGIGTESNNALGSATVFTLDSNDNFTTDFNSTSLSGSFIDSGSNGYFFPDSSIPACSDNTSFYCPTMLQNLSATNVGTNNAQSMVSFSIDNADNLLNNNPNDAVFPALGGPLSGSFDWGLPFFYGRSVFTSIDGQTVPSGQPAAPWWAY